MHRLRHPQQTLHGRPSSHMERDLRVDLGFRGMPMTEEQRRQFSPGPRTTMFRIPEFKWSPMHQRLLTDLLFALETDVHVWRRSEVTASLRAGSPRANILFSVHTSLLKQLTSDLVKYTSTYLIAFHKTHKFRLILMDILQVIMRIRAIFRGPGVGPNSLLVTTCMPPVDQQHRRSTE